MVSTIEIMDIILARVAKRQQRRFWTTEQKRRIVAEARAFGASVAVVARRVVSAVGVWSPIAECGRRW